VKVNVANKEMRDLVMEANEANSKVDQASGNAPLFAAVHALLPDLRKVNAPSSTAGVAAHVAALEEQLVADAPDPTVVLHHIEEIQQRLQEQERTQMLLQRLQELRKEFTDRQPSA
jgi:hypothetical protein